MLPGSIFDGEWLDGKMDGHGIYQYANGNVYEVLYTIFRVFFFLLSENYFKSFLMRIILCMNSFLSFYPIERVHLSETARAALVRSNTLMAVFTKEAGKKIYDVVLIFL